MTDNFILVCRLLGIRYCCFGGQAAGSTGISVGGNFAC